MKRFRWTMELEFDAKDEAGAQEQVENYFQEGLDDPQFPIGHGELKEVGD